MSKAQFNPAVAQLDMPAIPQAASWTTHYDGRYGKVMDFSQAVPDFVPHESVLAELSLQAGHMRSSGYGAIEGEMELRVAYASHVSSLYQQPIAAQNIHVTSGCNQAFVASLIATAASADTVLVCNPCYFNHESTASMLGINLRYIDCLAGNGFQPDVDELEACLDDTVKVIALVSPNNPTGAIYSSDTLRQIFTLCQQRGIWLILDETYRDFSTSGSNKPSEVPHDLFAQEHWQDTFIQLYSFSKSFSIPGHRLGAVTAGIQTIESIAKVMDNIQICPPRAAQLAVACQLQPMQGWIADNRKTIAQRSVVFQRMLQQFPDWKIGSTGAYFAYVQHPFTHQDSLPVAKTLAHHYGVLTLPGSFFGHAQERYLRVAFANVSSSVIEALAERLKAIETSDFNALPVR